MTRQTNIRNHYERVWGIESEFCQFSAGPIHQVPFDFSVIKVPPHSNRQMWTYATCCMSQPGDPNPIELHMFSPHESEEIVELLFACAHYHRTASMLNLGHSVNFGRPWMEGSQCEYGLVSLPYLDGPALENFLSDSQELKFYWLIPLAQSEIEFKERNGQEALEEIFDKNIFDYSNPSRRAMV